MCWSIYTNLWTGHMTSGNQSENSIQYMDLVADNIHKYVLFMPLIPIQTGYTAISENLYKSQFVLIKISSRTKKLQCFFLFKPIEQTII